ncbi:MAG: acyl-CoA thioesterase [Acidobacteriota bacterium]|nr:acyl-CoA thioesterase [Acidobacteriota bacterium]
MSVLAYPVHLDVEVRFRDLDSLRHVNNAVFFTYLEMAREAYWNVAGRRLDLDGFGFILARAECDFRAPILAGSAVRVRIRCPRLGGKSWDYEYRVEDRESGALFAEARSVQVYYHFPSGRTHPVPAEVRAAIARLEAPAAASS